VLKSKPDMVAVYGDVNSTMAASLVAAKLGIKLAHVEAGLRSFDRGMPEEINRLITDQLSDLLFTRSPDGDQNLAREGIDSTPYHWRCQIPGLAVNSPFGQRSRLITKPERLSPLFAGFLFGAFSFPDFFENRFQIVGDRTIFLLRLFKESFFDLRCQTQAEAFGFSHGVISGETNESYRTAQHGSTAKDLNL
jgi:hypothetical protein